MISLLCTPGGEVERGRPKTERFGVVLGLFSHLLGPSGCSIRAGGSPRVTLQRLPGWPCPQGMLSTRSCSSHPSFRWPQSRIFFPVRPQSWIFLLPALPQSRIFLPAPQRAPRRHFQAQKHRRGVAKSWFGTTTRENGQKTGRKLVPVGPAAPQDTREHGFGEQDARSDWVLVEDQRLVGRGGLRAPGSRFGVLGRAWGQDFLPGVCYGAPQSCQVGQ